MYDARTLDDAIQSRTKDVIQLCLQASEIAATVGQAFLLAYEKFQDTMATQMGFKHTKVSAAIVFYAASIIIYALQIIMQLSDLDKLDFAKQVVELQAKVKEMEDQAEAKDKPPRDEVKGRKE